MDRLVLMSEGAIVAEGKPADVLTPDLLGRIYRVKAVSGAENGAPYVIPWSRL
jgi:iron complex transport system ATP-binding protein